MEGDIGELMKTEHTYKAGVLIIGSLYWDNTNGRRPWREHYFGENFQQHQISVEVPIRYGRFSTSRECPTMVLSSKFHQEEKSGLAIFLPFKNQQMTVTNLICAARDLSQAEGESSNVFIKGGGTKWCILLYYLNPEIRNKKKGHFERAWKKAYNVKITDDILTNFKMESEPNSIFYKSGRIKGFPSELREYDILLMTQTQPRRTVRDKSEYSTVDEVGEEFFQKPEYFLKNRINGIKTFDDTRVFEILMKKDTDQFIRNAEKNNCSSLEIETFIKNHLRN